MGTPEKPKKMTFESFAGKTADAWEIEEGLSGLSLDSALERHSSPIANDVPQPEALTTKVEVGEWVTMCRRGVCVLNLLTVGILVV